MGGVFGFHVPRMGSKLKTGVPLHNVPDVLDAPVMYKNKIFLEKKDHRICVVW